MLGCEGQTSTGRESQVNSELHRLEKLGKELDTLSRSLEERLVRVLQSVVGSSIEKAEVPRLPQPIVPLANELQGIGGVLLETRDRLQSILDGLEV